MMLKRFSFRYILSSGYDNSLQGRHDVDLFDHKDNGVRNYQPESGKKKIVGGLNTFGTLFQSIIDFPKQLNRYQKYFQIDQMYKSRLNPILSLIHI